MLGLGLVLQEKWKFLKIKVTLLGFGIIRIVVVFGRLHWGPLFWEATKWLHECKDFRM